MGTLRPFLLMILIAGCSAPDTSGVRLIGHGGLGPGAEYPMNSREALLGALERGLDGVELDVQLTADSVLVAYHDMELPGTGHCTGVLNDQTWAQLKDCSVAGPTGNAHSIVRVDSFLLEAIAHYPEADFTLDVKLNTKGEWWPYLNAFSAALKTLGDRPALEGRVLVECQTEDLLELLHTTAPDLPVFLYASEAGTGIAKAFELGCTGITIDADRINAQEVERAHASGLVVTVFGVRGPWAMRSVLKLKPDRIQMDQ